MTDIVDSELTVLEHGVHSVMVPALLVPTVVSGAWGLGALALRLKISDEAFFQRIVTQDLRPTDEDYPVTISMIFDRALKREWKDTTRSVRVYEKQEA